MEDKQRQLFNDLMKKELPSVIDSNVAEISNDIDLRFEYIDMDTTNPLMDEHHTAYVPISAACTLRNKRTTESVTFNVNLLKMPVYQELGFMIRGNYMQMLDAYDKAAGLHTSRKQTQSSDTDTAIVQSENFRSVGFIRSKTKLYTKLNVRSNINDAIEVSPVTFLRAITGMSKDELVAKFSYHNNFVVTLFDSPELNFPEVAAGYPCTTGSDCIRAVYAAMFGKAAEKNTDNGTISIKLAEIKKWLFKKEYFNKGNYAIQRIRYMQSFSYRAAGAVLAKDVNANGISIAAGTVLTTQLLRELDATELTELMIEHNNVNYVLHRFARYWFGGLNHTILESFPELGIEANTILSLDDIDALNNSNVTRIHVKDLSGNERVLSRDVDNLSLTQDDIFAVFDLWVNNLNGLDAYDKEFDLTNRILVPFDKRVIQLVKSYMNAIVRRISAKYAVKGDTVNLNDYIEGYDKDIDVDAFIDQIRSPELKLGQMAELCNIMSFTSKDYKSTIANLKNIDDNLVAIQDHQYGRTDPFDIPESQKLASVQHRTLNSKLDEAGSITVPYLRVHNGQVTSDEPVYLTATEETDRYIAEWCETFVDEDGNKKDYVLARYNGEIVSIATDNVSYKEMSPYDGMSISHACIPFPGHSDGKRITMGCNQLSQATPMAHKERPEISGGGESMIDYGFYTGEKVLADYYNRESSICPILKQYKDKILNSDLKLVSKRTTHGSMKLTLKVLAMPEIYEAINNSAEADITQIFSEVSRQTIELTVPYANQTTDNTLMTYEINPMPDNVYKAEDVICCSNSCSTENKDRCDCIEAGNQLLTEDMLSKGLALAKGLRIGYKTWSGSTIDDAMVISDECVYGDILTSIFTTRIVNTAKAFSETEFEKFGIGAGAPSYFEENGLPKIGTYLSAGDPVIAKISHTKGAVKMKFKYLTMNQSGQVVYAGFTTKNDEEAAEVILAQRNVTEVGDKYAGRCGNKGVVAKIVPAEQMPFDPETGFRLQAILNPLGVPSRGNLSQFLDMDSTECLREDNKFGCVSPYNKNDLQWVLDLKEIHNVRPKIFIDGRTGKPFERPIHWGTLPMYKLHHMIKKKYHAIGMTSPVDPVYMQPRQGSKMDGGQSFGEMESWCLMSINATHILQEVYSYQSTDIGTRNQIRKNLEKGMPAPYDVAGNNSNNATMLACYRSLGVDFKTNFDSQTFEFRPLTDDAIHALSPTPVDSVENLHNSNIFRGGSAEYAIKDQARDVWSWIDLKLPLVHPNFIKNSNVLHFIKADSGTFNDKVADDIMRGRLLVAEVHDPTTVFHIYRTAKLAADEYAGLPDEADATESLITGIPALTMMFQYSDTESLEAEAKGAVDTWLIKHGMQEDDPALGSEKGYIDRLRSYADIHMFNQVEKLSDYVITAFPVMPQIYRPKFATSRQTDHVDFDWHYARILAAIATYERNETTEAAYAIYDAISAFCGLKTSSTVEEKKHKNIKTYFRGPDGDHGDHGKLRTHVQSKRVYCSGRTTIIPAHDTRMKPTEIGVPITLAVKMFESVLIGKFASKWTSSEVPMSNHNVSQLLLQCAKRNKPKFKSIWERAFSGMMSIADNTAYAAVTEMIYDCVEARDGNPVQVVLCGRQPSLHKYAIRAYLPKIVLENTINVHTLVCSGYNADFDGDQMWIQALISEEAKEEALRLLSPEVDYINPKDSSLILKHTQDVVLGLYCMSMLKNNATHVDITASGIYHYANIDQMLADLDADIIHTYDIACLSAYNRRYLGTVGRLYLNYISDGLTEDQFTNPLQIPDIKTENYCEMKYDGIWRSGGNVKTGNFRYFKIADVCMDYYSNDQQSCIDFMQKLTELGFKYADKFCISLSLEDMMLQPVDACETLTDPKLIELNAKSLEEICNDGLVKADELRVAIEQDYYDGLISEEDKDDAIVSLFYSGTGDSDSEYCTGVHSQVQKQLMNKLSLTQRNNNIFIMLDSGARGKADQIMRMCGFLPQLQKDKQSSLKTPVTHSFLQGLSSFDVHMTSYGIKQGLASTQNETPDAGYATHKGVYMTSGFKVVETDCGKTNWWYDVKYTDIDDSKSLFMPSMDWFNDHLLGRTVSASDKDAVDMFGMSDDLTITNDHYVTLMKNGGFHSIEVNDGIYEISVDSVIGNQILRSDKTNKCKLMYTLHNDCLTTKSVDLIKRCHIRDLSTPDGAFSFKYKMDPCSKSLLLHRQCKDLPYTKTLLDSDLNEVEVTTKKTVAYIEEKNLTRVPVRILLDCKSEHGVCSHCYGLKFSSLTFPKVGDFVGTESAQAIGEPSAQLTISLINQGGTAGAAIDDGVKRFSSLLDGSVKNAAIIAPRSGYVKIDQLGQSATVSIRPINKDCDLCFGCSSNGECPSSMDGKVELPPCAFKKSVNAQLLTCKDGDWVEASQPLTCQIPNPSDVTSVTPTNSLQDTADFDLVYRKKQTTWLQNYYETFSSKGIEINARHFEIFARVQNLQGNVFYSEDPKFKPGSSYEITSLQKASGKVLFTPKLSSRADVIMDTSGAMAALSFERVQSIAASLCVKAYDSPYAYNNSLLGDVAVGTDLIAKTPKNFTITKSVYKKAEKIKPTVFAPVEYKEIEVKDIDATSSVLDDFDFEALLGNAEPTPMTVESPNADPAVVSTPNATTTVPVQMDFGDVNNTKDIEETQIETESESTIDVSLDEFDEFDSENVEGSYDEEAEEVTTIEDERNLSNNAAPVLMDF